MLETFDDVPDSDICGVQRRIPLSVIPTEAARLIYAPNNESVWALIRGKLLELLDEENYDEEGTSELAAFIDLLKPSIYKSALEDEPIMSPQIFPTSLSVPGAILKRESTSGQLDFVVATNYALGGYWQIEVTEPDARAGFRHLLAAGDYRLRLIAARLTTSANLALYVDDQLITNDFLLNGSQAANVAFNATFTLATDGLHEIEFRRAPSSPVGATTARMQLITVTPNNSGY